MSKRQVTIIGAGIIGLSVGYHLIKAGQRVTVIDRDPEGDKASFGNAGAIAVTEIIPASSPAVWARVFGWMMDPLGPLAVRPAHAPALIPWLWQFARAGLPSEVERLSSALAVLNSRAYDDLDPMLADLGLSDELNRTGALSVYETEAGYERERPEWARKQALGIAIERLTGDQAREMEPALGPLVKRAVFAPQWSYLNDPKRLVDELRRWLQRSGALISKGEVTRISAQPGSAVLLDISGGPRLSAECVVIAAGAWSGILARQVGDRVLLESERGYNMTLPHPAVSLGRELIFAERKFVATPLSCGLRIGGAAEFGGLDAKPNDRRSRALVTLARKYLPGLETEGGTSWSGHRPTTPDSLPVIGPSPRSPNVFYAFGHAHLGLTQAATTGKLVCDQILGTPPAMDLKSYGIERFSRLRHA